MVNSHSLHETTYNKPVANTATIIIFFLGGIFSFHMGIIGTTRIAISETTLNTPLAIVRALIEKQWPSVIRKFQIFSRGVQVMIEKMVSII